MSSTFDLAASSRRADTGRPIVTSAFAVLFAALSVAGLACAARWLVEQPRDLRSLVSIAHDTPSFSDRFSVVSFEQRFQPTVESPLATAPSAVGGQVAWFDATTFGGHYDRFIKPAGAQIAALPPAAEPKVLAVVPAAATPVPNTSPREIASLIPMPAVRPSELRDLRGAQEPASPRTRAAFSHDALVKKARLALVASAGSDKTNWLTKLFGRDETPPVMAYASASPDDVTGAIKSDDTPSPIDRLTAVYDITAKTVYMPDGSKLEAHSGLGDKIDRPAYAHVRMQGVTPPHIYDLKPREALFHGVAALRMTPLGGEGAIHNRTGLLAHTYMLGPNGDSNGCISFRDYDRFLQAYNKGLVKRIVVVGALN